MYVWGGARELVILSDGFSSDIIILQISCRYCFLNHLMQIKKPLFPG